MIKSGANDQCVLHGLSVMRLALGYEKGLPDDLTYLLRYRRTIKGVIYATSVAFSDRPVVAWASTHNCIHYTHIEMLGEILPYRQHWWDNWLFAFAYQDPATTDAHWVIGDPVVYGKTRLALVIAVKIDLRR